MKEFKLENGTKGVVKKLELDTHSAEFFLNKFYFVTARLEGEDFDRTFWWTETELEEKKNSLNQ